MKLYYSPGTCSLAPHILLNEIGQKPETIKVDMASKALPDGSDYRKVNPKGYVPTLALDNGELHTEVAILLQIIADKAGRTDLLPKYGTAERYKAMETLNFISSELHKGIGGLFNPTMPEEGKAAIRQRASLRLTYLNELLGKQNYMLGDNFSVADCYAFTVLNWAGNVGLDLSSWPNIMAYQARIAARPAVQATLKEEGLIA